MTNVTKSIMVAAAALTLAGVASAQGLKADIPFAFQVGNKLMQPGSYVINRVSSSGVEMFRLWNPTVHEAAITVASAAHDPAKEWKADGKARVVFACGASRCALSELWDGEDGTPAHQFPISKSRNETMRTAVIVAEPLKAD
jgi:hypothetical protein